MTAMVRAGWVDQARRMAGNALSRAASSHACAFKSASAHP